MERSPVRVLLVDDHALFRRGVAGLFAGRSDYEVVGEAADGHEAVRKALELRPDLVLMDIQMPGVGGVEATAWIRADLPSVKVVILTVSDDEEDVFSAIKAGAHGYLLKSVDPAALFPYLDGVMRGDAPVSGRVAAKILREIGARREARHELGGPEPLTAREREVLRLVAEGRSNRSVAEALGITENTVKNHMRNILEKLHAENRVQAAMVAIRERFIAGPG